MRALPRCFAPAAAAGHVVTLTADDAHHLTRVLRVGVGDLVGLFDGTGGEWIGRVRATRPEATVEIVDVAVPTAEPPVRVTLAIGLLKGGQMDAVVRDATMLGAVVIVPMSTDHVSVAREGRGAGDAVRRWERVAVASARQCRRAVVPAIRNVTPFAELLKSATAEATILCAEPGTTPLTLHPHERPASALVLVGPEGGWSEREVQQATAAGARPLGLGPRTLRAETAPTVALSCLWTLWGW